ncbi:hypothetical protein ACXR0O_08705 [Verrucomicrobiota bacterium sgz303538]
MAPSRSRDRIYLVRTEELATAAQRAIAAINELRELQDSGPCLDECHVQYQSRSHARDAAQLLNNQLRSMLGVRSLSYSGDWKERFVAHTTLRLSWGEWIGAAVAFDQLATEVLTANLSQVVISSSQVHHFAKCYLKLFSGIAAADPLALYSPQEAKEHLSGLDTRLWTYHENVTGFLRLVVSSAKLRRPTANEAGDSSIHRVIIHDVDSIEIDGIKVSMNRARRRALFTLKVLGTESFSDKEFAMLCNQTSNTPNPPNTVRDALQGLKKSLPNLFFFKCEMYLRTVQGVEINSRLSDSQLRKLIADLI